MSEIIHLRNTIRGLEDKRDHYLNLADETRDLITEAQEKLKEVTPKVYRVIYNGIEGCWELQEEYCCKNDRWTIIKTFMFKIDAQKHKENLDTGAE